MAAAFSGLAGVELAALAGVVAVSSFGVDATEVGFELTVFSLMASVSGAGIMSGFCSGGLKGSQKFVCIYTKLGSWVFILLKF